MTPGFDAASHELEAKLRDLRRLVAEMPFLTDEQDLLLADLTRALIAADATAHALRLSLLEVSGLPDAAPEPPAPAPLFTVAHLDLPETNHDPLPPMDDKARLALLREMRDVAREMGLPFDGEVELAELEAQIASAPTEETLPIDADLDRRYPDRRRVYPGDDRLWLAEEDRAYLLIVDLRPDTAPEVLAFTDDASRGAWLGKAYEAALSERTNRDDLRNPDDNPERGDDDDDGSSHVPARPTTPPPARPGGAERTVEEALAAPRNV